MDTENGIGTREQNGIEWNHGIEEIGDPGIEEQTLQLFPVMGKCVNGLEQNGKEERTEGRI